MVTVTKKRKALIAVAAVVALVAVIVPSVVYALPPSDASIAASRTLIAKGVAKELVNEENVTVPASFTLTLQRSSTDATVPRFDVTGGKVIVDGVSYTITSGNGGVFRGRHLILLQATGIQADGQTVTLRLAGRYFWMGGHLYVARIGARLLTPEGDFTLLLRTQIRV